MTQTQTRPRFLCSYAGEVDYVVDGEQYTVSYWFSDYHRNTTAPDYRYQRAAQVGTVRRSHNPTTFPPAHVLACFPGYVGMRYAVHRTCDVPYSGGILKDAGWADFTIEYTAEPAVLPLEQLGLRALAYAYAA